MEARCPVTVETALLRHLGVSRDAERCWTVKASSLGGLGLFASRDILPGETIAVDPPLLIGPRGQGKHLPLCVSCYKRDCPLFPCERGCGLPVCSERCENNESHVSRECGYLREHRPISQNGWSMDLLRLVLPVRGLFLDQSQRGLLDLLEHHRETNRGSPADLLASEVRVAPSKEESRLIERVCEVMNTTSFESAVLVEDSSGRRTSSIRALYPVGALQNHSCRPNTRFLVDVEHFCHIVASLAVSAGEELTMTYTELLWDTMLRRKWLYSTKHFYCSCRRCSDPLEFGTNLGALYCAADHCEGILLPRHPLDLETSWDCSQCPLTLNYKQILSIRLNLAKITEEMSYESPRQVLRFVRRELALLVPPTNYIMMNIKFRVVSYFGRTDGLPITSLTDAELQYKSKYCEDLLDVLDRLGCGDCKKKGLILYELYCSRAEKYRRLPSEMDVGEIKDLLRQATEILRGDVLAINDFESPPRI